MKKVLGLFVEGVYVQKLQHNTWHIGEIQGQGVYKGNGQAGNMV